MSSSKRSPRTGSTRSLRGRRAHPPVHGKTGAEARSFMASGAEERPTTVPGTRQLQMRRVRSLETVGANNEHQTSRLLITSVSRTQQASRLPTLAWSVEWPPDRHGLVRIFHKQSGMFSAACAAAGIVEIYRRSSDRHENPTPSPPHDRHLAHVPHAWRRLASAHTPIYIRGRKCHRPGGRAREGPRGLRQVTAELRSKSWPD